jgi:hypothetical protein
MRGFPFLCLNCFRLCFFNVNVNLIHELYYKVTFFGNSVYKMANVIKMSIYYNLCIKNLDYVC